MGLHPTAERYRQARAAGDDTAAAAIMIEAHTGAYNADLINQIHEVGRMTRAQLAADPEPAPVVRQRGTSVVQNVYLNGGGS